MKLRINADTIRLRLSQSEVDELVLKAEIWDHCHFGNSTLRYGIAAETIDHFLIKFENNCLKVTIPKQRIEGWNNDARVGFDWKPEKGPYILIEKDFKCMMPRENEDETDLYENPLAK